MKVKIVIETRMAEDSERMVNIRRSEVWSGELEILDKNEYLTLISVIGEGEPQPICQVPFATGIGHYMWIPPDRVYETISDNPVEDI